MCVNSFFGDACKPSELNCILIRSARGLHLSAFPFGFL